MTEAIDSYKQVNQVIQQRDIVVTREICGYTYDQDVVSPHLVILYCHRGTALGLYNMRNLTFGKNEVAVVLPNHVVSQLKCTDDFLFTRIFVSSEMFAEMRASSPNYDYDIFHLNPTCQLTDERATFLLKIIDLLDDISTFDADDKKLRHRLLLSQFFVGFEFIHYFFREQKRKNGENPDSELFTCFCKLVAEHYRESRKVKYYADLMNLSPKYFAKVIRQKTGGLSPTEWIEQYVVAQAKHLIIDNPSLTLGQIAYKLGFSEITSFYRYFKRVTGITAKQYRNSQM